MMNRTYVFVLALILLSVFVFPYSIRTENTVKAGEVAYAKFLNDDGTPARGLTVMISGGQEELQLKSDNAGYIYYLAEEVDSYSYKIYGGADTLIEFEQKTHVVGKLEAEAGNSIIANAAQAVQDMGSVLVESANIILPLFVLFLILSSIAVYFILKE